MKSLSQYIFEKLNLDDDDIIPSETHVFLTNFEKIVKKCYNNKHVIDNIYKELNENASNIFIDSSYKLEWWKPWNATVFYGNRTYSVPLLVVNFSANESFSIQFFDDFSKDTYDGLSSSKEEIYKMFKIDKTFFKEFKQNFINFFDAEISHQFSESDWYICKYKNIVSEKLNLDDDENIKAYKYHPKTKEELQKIIKQLIEERGNNANLNDVDVSEITDMSLLFNKLTKFNGDISQWDVSNVKTMDRMFAQSNFTGENGDITGWDVSNVEDMTFMFAYTNFNQQIGKWNMHNVRNISGMFGMNEYFNQDISNWDIQNIKEMAMLFYCAKSFNKDLSKWDVSNVEDMTSMFYFAKSFNKDLSKWKINKACKTEDIFTNCPIKEEYKPKFK